METNLVKINASDYGLDEIKAQQIEEQFKPMLEKMAALEVEYNDLLKLKINPETCTKAYELRKKYVKVRTGTADIHKAQKAFYLAGGRFVDGWKNAQLFASQGIEEKLTAIEKHYENLEKDKVIKLQAKRAEQLEQYGVEVIPDNLGDMRYEMWNNYFTGVKVNDENQKAAALKTEEDRIERERAEAEEREKIRLDNIRLQKEADERERIAKKEQADRQKVEAERLEKERVEREAREKREARERSEHEATLKTEREAREKIETELRENKEEEERIKQKEAAAIQYELNKGDADKVNDLVIDLNSLKTKYQFKSAKNKEKYIGMAVLIDKVVKYISE